MTIDNPVLFMESLWDWGILKGCFGPVIAPTDIDGMVEHCGHILILDSKHTNARIREGQKKAYQVLARRGMTVFVMYGEKNSPERITVFDRDKPYGWATEPCDLESVRKRCQEWYEWARKNPFKFTTGVEM